MAQVRWVDEAVDQLDAIVAYVELYDPAAADDIAVRLFRLAASLESFPNRGRPAPYGTRELVTVRPYILSYIVVGGLLSVLGVRHNRQLPPR